MVRRLLVVALCLAVSACFEIDVSSEVREDGSVTSHADIAVLPLYLAELQEFADGVRGEGIDVEISTREDGYFVASWVQDGSPLSNDWTCSNMLVWTTCKFNFFKDATGSVDGVPPNVLAEVSDIVPKLTVQVHLPDGADVVESNADYITDREGSPRMLWHQRADEGPFDIHFEVRL